MKLTKWLKWFMFAFLAIGIGLYPFGYAISDVLVENGLLSQKQDNITSNQAWSLFFYIHIYCGGIALLTGWSQFIRRFRNRYLKLHRSLGKLYLLSILLSGISGFYIAVYAEGGLIAKLGFSFLAIAWLFTSLQAYLSIRKRQINKHENWMIRSYALTFAAVTLRLWIPLFQFGFGMGFTTAYVIIAWLCWVPNLIWAEWKIRGLRYN